MCYYAKIIGGSDPYCIFSHGSRQTRKSKVCTKTLNPVWNESFELPIDTVTPPLVVQCFDWDRFSADDSLGEGRVSLYDLVEGQPKEICVKVCLKRPQLFLIRDVLMLVYLLRSVRRWKVESRPKK